MFSAMNISLSKTALFFPLCDALSVLMFVVFFREERQLLLSFHLLAGVAICFAGMWLCSFRKNNNKSRVDRKWILFVAGMVAIFALGSFSIKIFSLQLGLGTFLANYFGGNFLGSALILLLEKQKPLPMPKVILTYGVGMAVAHWLATAAIAWTYVLGGPAGIVLPLRGIFVTAIPILFGWWFLEERRNLSMTEKWGFAVCALGGALVLM